MFRLLDLIVFFPLHEIHSMLEMFHLFTKRRQNSDVGTFPSVDDPVLIHMVFRSRLVAELTLEF